MPTINRLKELIEKDQITQKQMAIYLGVSVQQLNRWLKRGCKLSRLWEKEINRKLDLFGHVN